jgi:hypothetical protein
MAARDEVRTGTIEVRIHELAQLYNSLDPSPFHERDLDDDAEEHIVGWARELPPDVPITIIVDLPAEEARKAQDRGLEKSISNYFADRAAYSERNFRELFRIGWRYLAIGLPVLAACLVASQIVRANLGTGAAARVLEESLIIVGWVANWKPLETFLYDWLPLKRQRDLYRRLAKAGLVLRDR